MPSRVIREDDFKRRLESIQPKERHKLNRNPVSFTREQVEIILAARARGVTWREINDNLPYPYATERTCGYTIRRLARAYNLELPTDESNAMG